MINPLPIWISKLLPWITESFENRYTFTRVGTPTYISNLSQQCCKYNSSGFRDKNMRPTLSPDINQMDFAISSIKESDVTDKLYSCVAALKNVFCFIVCFG